MKSKKRNLACNEVSHRAFSTKRIEPSADKTRKREPLAAKRCVDITNTRKAVDWAFQIKDLVDVKFPDVKKIILVMDNLNAHNGASLYKAFPPEEARRILDGIEFHYTQKHGSWLNMAGIELSVLGRQCLNRRMPDQEKYKKRGYCPAGETEFSRGTNELEIHNKECRN